MPSDLHQTLLPESGDVLDTIPEHFGPRLRVAKGGVALTVQPPGMNIFKVSADFLAVFLAPVQRFEVRVGEERHSFRASAGGLIISPAGAEGESRWLSPLECIAIGFQRGYLDELAKQELGIEVFRLYPPPIGLIDGRALEMAQLLRHELSSETPNELFIDSLMTAAGIHVIRSYSAPLIAPKPKVGELSQRNVRRVKKFLAEHFDKKPSISYLAALCGFSSRHFIQAFTKSFGMTPYRYIIDIRLDEAMRLLFDSELTIAEVAYRSGFSSQSHLTSAMKRYRGQTPAQIRRKS